MMHGVVSAPEGTANISEMHQFPPSVVVGGKTGTADHCAGTTHCPPPHAWFTGFALEKGQPKIAVAVIIENGGVNGNETTGGLAAGPVAAKVISAYLHSPAGG
jgi:peptidoglycan glycosyltransferase